MNREGLTVFLCSLETDIREQKSMKKEYRHLWIIQSIDLRYEIMFENHVKDQKITFLLY